jgi:hypothetical protein
MYIYTHIYIYVPILASRITESSLLAVKVFTVLPVLPETLSGAVMRGWYVTLADNSTIQ